MSEDKQRITIVRTNLEHNLYDPSSQPKGMPEEEILPTIGDRLRRLIAKVNEKEKASGKEPYFAIPLIQIYDSELTFPHIGEAAEIRHYILGASGSPMGCVFPWGYPAYGQDPEIMSKFFKNAIHDPEKIVGSPLRGIIEHIGKRDYTEAYELLKKEFDVLILEMIYQP